MTKVEESLSKLINKRDGFLESNSSFKEARAVLIGAPMDYTVSFRAGSRGAPMAIRHLSEALEEYSLSAKKDLRDINFYDAGDIILPFGNVESSLTLIDEAVSLILAEGKIPFLMGGDHLVSFPAVKAAHRFYEDLVLLHIDAHADLRPHYMDEPLSHASVICRILEEVGVKDVYQFGIRSGTKEELDYASEKTTLFLDEVIKPLKDIMPELKGRPVYLTVDIDVVDPAFAPGTGTPEPGGITSRDFLGIPKLLSTCQIVGMDLVEVSPPYDTAEITALLAAKFIREALLHFVN